MTRNVGAITFSSYSVKNIPKNDLKFDYSFDAAELNYPRVMEK